MKRIFILFIALLISVVQVEAKQSKRESKRESKEQSEVAAASDDKKRKGEEREQNQPKEPKVRESRFERIDRIDYRAKSDPFIYKGEVMLGLTASHNSISSDNAEYLTLLTNMTVDGHITSIKPFGGYFYRDNKAVGCRLGYVTYGGTIDSTTLDLGETNDLSFDVPYINLSSTNYSYSIFHRSYAPLDKAGHFGVYAEVELAASNGESVFEYENNGEINSSKSKNQSYTLSFNPGISAFMFHNVCASFSFQFGGFDYTKIRQYDDTGEMIGSRQSSKMKFMFNVFAVNFGITVHLW